MEEQAAGKIGPERSEGTGREVGEVRMTAAPVTVLPPQLATGYADQREEHGQTDQALVGGDLKVEVMGPAPAVEVPEVEFVSVPHRIPPEVLARSDADDGVAE